MDDYSKLKNLFSNIDPKKLEAAVKKAQMLSQNPRVREAFTKTDSSKLASLISSMNENEKQRLMNELSKPQNAELLKIIKNNM